MLDGLGHTRLLLDSSGNITDRYSYDGWGNPIEQTGATFNPFRWNAAYGYEWTPAIGLYHVGAREYDPRTARWLQRDPIDAASGDPNLYRYCGNDPVNWTDPDGQKIMIITIYDDFIGALPDALAGDLIGGGGGLLYALSFQNKPTRTGYARLGRANPSARYGWERSFHIDYHPRYGTHFNADFGPLSRFNHSTLPDWARNIGTNRALRNIGRGAVALGLALDALSILTAPPCEKGRAIGGAIGGAGGSIVGAAVGSAIAPGVGTIIGGAAGGFLGGLVGDWLGSRFRPEGSDCP